MKSTFFLKSIIWLYAPFYENTRSLDELHWKPNHTKKFKSWNFEGKGFKAKDLFFKPFDRKMFNGSKCLALDVGHMCRK